MSTTLNFIVGAISQTEGYHWERSMLSALTDGVLTEAAGAQTLLHLVAPDGGQLILTGNFNVMSATEVTGTLTSFELRQDSQLVLTAAFTHTVNVEDVAGIGGGSPTLDDLIEGLQAIYGSQPVTENGSPDSEMMFGGHGDDIFNGNAGDERLTGYEGADTFDGGANGWDDVRYNLETGSMGIIANLSDTDRTVGAVTVAGKHVRDTYGFTDSIHNINFIAGTEHEDFFFGRDGDGEFGDYPDFVSGAAGNDTFTSGTGAIGVAYDQADIDNGGHAVLVNLGSGTKYSVAGGHAVDTFGDTDTLVNIHNVALSQMNDTAVGGNGSDHFWGRAGADLMFGNSGNDQFEGDEGKDYIDGGKGKDTLSGGLDRDTLTGGKDADQFVYFAVVESKAKANQRDFITDFQHGTDKIHLQAIDAIEGTNKNDKFKLDAMGDKGDDVAKGHIGWYQIDKPGDEHDRTIVVINVDSDKAFEMSIELNGLINLTKADFIL